MRMHLFAIAALSACSPAAEAPREEAVPAALGAGLWKTGAEVSAVRALEQGTPLIAATKGEKSESETCVAAAEIARPPASLFVGDAYKCTYQNVYVRNGRINAALTCSREGLDGTVAITVEGRFTAAGFTGTSSANSYSAAAADMRIDTALTGTRTGDCPAGGAPKKGA